MDWTEEKAEQAEETLRKWWLSIRGVEGSSPIPAVLDALADDLNTAGAIAEMHAAFKRGDLARLKFSASLLGMLQPNLMTWAEPRIVSGVGKAVGISSANAVGMAIVTWQSLGQFEEWSVVRRLLEERNASKAKRDFARADEIRKFLLANSMVVIDKPDGPELELMAAFDRSKLEALK